MERVLCVKRKSLRTCITLPLAAVMLITCFTACTQKKESENPASVESSVAVESTEPTYTEPTITVGRVEVHGGDTVSVPIMFRKSPGIAACRLLVEFDNENLELQSLSYGPAFSENGEEPGKTTSPMPLTWSQLENVEGDELFAELVFRVNEEAKLFSVFPITVRYAHDDVVDLDEEEISFAVENGSIEIVK